MPSPERALDASITVYDKSPASLSLLRKTIGALKQFDPIIEEWLGSNEIELLCICLNGATPPMAFSMAARNEADLYARVLNEAAGLMPVDALATATLAAQSRDMMIKCDLVWQQIVAQRLASRGGAH